MVRVNDRTFSAPAASYRDTLCFKHSKNIMFGIDLPACAGCINIGACGGLDKLFVVLMIIRNEQLLSFSVDVWTK